MTNNRILQIIREEAAHQEGLLFEGMSYIPQRGYRNNQLITEQSSSTWDDVQNLLGWAGFIPVIGDVIDAVNGVIYFFRNKIMLGAFSLIAALPGVGSVLAKSITTVYNKIGKPFMAVFKKLFTNGSGAAKALFELVGKSSKWVQGKLAPLFTALKNAAGGISTFLGKINVASFNKKILDFTGGWFGLPPVAVKTIDGFVKQLKGFFNHMAKPPSALVHVTQKAGEHGGKDIITHFTKEEEVAIEKKYNDGTVNKKDYPTLDHFIKKQIELKNATSKLNKMGGEFNKKSIKKVLAWMKQKEGNEIKLWSKWDGVVKLVQQAVGVEPDGSFGTDTEKAVKIAQKKHGLAQDGVVGPETWEKIT